MSRMWRQLDQEISRTPMPADYSASKVTVKIFAFCFFLIKVHLKKIFLNQTESYQNQHLSLLSVASSTTVWMVLLILFSTFSFGLHTVMMMGWECLPSRNVVQVQFLSGLSSFPPSSKTNIPIPFWPGERRSQNFTQSSWGLKFMSDYWERSFKKFSKPANLKKNFKGFEIFKVFIILLKAAKI